MFVFLGMYPISKSECIVSNAGEKIDVNGMVTDEKTRERIRQLLEALVDWAERLKFSG